MRPEVTKHDEENSRGFKIMTQSSALIPLVHLQENASEFFNKMQSKNADKMICAAGCSRCCYVSLSVFESEAARIVDWFNALDEVEQKNAVELWKNIAGDMALAFDGKNSEACAFLKNNKCTIYEARPTLCRTQGAALQLKKEMPNGEITIAVDCCPLNFKGDNSLPPKEDWLDLDRLASMQSIAENQYQLRGRNLDFQEICKKNGRVSLKKLQEWLIQKN